MKLLLRIVAILGPISGTLLLWAAQVGPEDAVSNLAKWARLAGVDTPPLWLQSQSADIWATVGGCIAIAAGALAIFLWIRLRRKQVTPASSPASSTPDRKTLLELFKTDFEHTLRTEVETTATRPDGFQYKFVTKAFQDFQSGGWFGGFYLPRAEEGIGYAVAASLANDFDRLLADAKNGVAIKSKDPGDSSPVEFKDLVFSRRIYLYHEDDYSLKQQSDLTEAFKEKSVSLQLRGPSYVTSRWMSDKIKAANKPPK